MSRPRLTIGTFGDVGFQTAPNGRVTARARYRDWDGKSRLVQATGDTKRAAEQALKARLAERSLFQQSGIGLSPDSTFPDLVAYWLEDLDLEGRLSKTTRQLYERNMRTLALPVFKDLTLREIGVARCDRFLMQLAKQSYNRAKQARVALRLAFELAVRHEVLPRNPMDHVSRLRKPPSTPNALTPAEVNAIRAAITYWEAGRSPSGPKPDGQLGAIAEVMLGTSARIGEALAIRRRDIDVASATPSIRITGTIVSHRGEPTMRQDHPKTAKSRRTVAIPSFTAEAVRRRLARLDDASLDAFLFCSREGTPVTTNNVRRQLRHVLDLAGIEGVTPHMFRRTVATAISNEAGVDLAAELLGHTDPKITIQHYIRRNEMVDPRTAAMLDRAFGKEG
ncbi:tyrosine-type recombinase/integrase [Gulosibacter molinativorax]|uniref:Site-specific integrase n=1 Tax=Gulosibacter molinativorax TaxID=256821 RepID=A0ABT7CB99_9MICO|nr:site-specific integrase [Gulosibacter molinativorax]MDJ1372437.1 site-specific integrase [Gulosibacter molinativorax]QUY61210.1 Tyrosine recombinase XerD [Gulosibacter molinativorax]